MSVKAEAYAQKQRTAFAQRLKRLRQEAGLTQEELAELTGLTARLVSDYENGTAPNPKLDTLFRLAYGLGVRPRKLIEGEDG